MAENPKVYLGDSVYVEFDGYHVVLTVQNGLGPTETIALEDMVFVDLLKFAEKSWNLKIDVKPASTPRQQ